MDIPVRGLITFSHQMFFFTNWGDLATCLYFLFTVLLCSWGSEKISRILSAFQHGVAANQALIVLIYWGILVPSKGILVGMTPPKEFVYYLKGLNYYKHIFPFCAIFIDLFASRQTLGYNGVIVATIMIGLYIPWNLFIHFVYGITPYKTDFTSGDSNLQ